MLNPPKNDNIEKEPVNSTVTSETQPKTQEVIANPNKEVVANKKQELDRKAEELQAKIHAEETKSTDKFLNKYLETFKKYLDISVEKLRAWLKKERNFDLQSVDANNSGAIEPQIKPEVPANINSPKIEPIKEPAPEQAEPVAVENTVPNTKNPAPEINPPIAAPESQTTTVEDNTPQQPEASDQKVNTAPASQPEVASDVKTETPAPVEKPIEEIKENPEYRKMVNEIIDELGFDKETADEIKAFISLAPPEKLLAYGQSFDEIAYACPNRIYLLQKAFEGYDNEKGVHHDYDKKLLISHELGHFLTNNELIYSKDELAKLEELIGKIGPDFKLTDEERKVLPKGFGEILDLLSDNRDIDSTPDHLANKETNHIILQLKNLNNDAAMQNELKRYNEHSIVKIDSIDEYRKIYRDSIAQEVIAERVSTYLPSKNKSNSLDMLVQRINITPNLQKFMGIEDKDFAILEAALKEVRERSDLDPRNIDAVVEIAKSKGMPEDKLNNIKNKLDIFNGENKIFFELFKDTLGKIEPNKIKEMLHDARTKKDNEKKFDFDDDELEEILGGGYIGESPSLGASRGGGEGFIEWIVKFLSMLFKA
jgi:hypothetical protein